MRIAVCDDNELFLKEIGAQLKELDMAESIHFYAKLEIFLAAVEDGAIYDAVLMDIDWQEERSGMDVAEALYRKLSRAKIIYVTGYNDRFSQHIFLHRANLSGYLTKPVDPKLLKANLQKVFETLMLSEGPGMLLNVRGSGVHVPFREIIYIDSLDHIVTVHTVNEQIRAYIPLNQVVKQLPEGFYQCHRSFVVNLRQIRRFRFPDILMKNGEQVPVSRARYKEAKKAYFQYMGDFF